MTPRARPLAPAARRQAILDAVLPLVMEQGGKVSTREIAEAAGVAEGTIFRVFKDKAELMWALAEQVINPPHAQEDFEAMLDGVDDLHERVRLAAAALVSQMRRAMMVMMALRGQLQKPVAAHDHNGAPASPEFLVRANRELLERLTFLFDPHADQLRIPSETAAVILRALIFGSHHPGMDLAPDLTPDQIADVVVDGVTISRGTV